MEITRFNIHYVTMKGKSKIKKVKPTDSSSLLRIKHDLATALNKIKQTDDINYYYVVMESTKDGEPAYRTIIRKTFING